jgi:translation initiation factor 1 (eIF-1/SUI1)
LQGDQRNAVRDFLVSTGIVSEREAKEKIQM